MFFDPAVPSKDVLSKPLRLRTEFASSCVLKGDRCPPSSWQTPLASLPVSGGATQTYAAGKGKPSEAGTPGQEDDDATTPKYREKKYILTE